MSVFQVIHLQFHVPENKSFDFDGSCKNDGRPKVAPELLLSRAQKCLGNVMQLGFAWCKHSFLSPHGDAYSDLHPGPS